MDKREFLKRSMVGAVALGTSSKISKTFADTNDTPKDRSVKRKLGKTGFDVFPVVYGGIISMRDGQDASNNYVAWSRDRGINYFDVHHHMVMPKRNWGFLSSRIEKIFI